MHLVRKKAVFIRHSRTDFITTILFFLPESEDMSKTK